MKYLIPPQVDFGDNELSRRAEGLARAGHLVVYCNETDQGQMSPVDRPLWPEVATLHVDLCWPRRRWFMHGVRDRAGNFLRSVGFLSWQDATVLWQEPDGTIAERAPDPGNAQMVDSLLTATGRVYTEYRTPRMVAHV